jgi:hypothetical protein
MEETNFRSLSGFGEVARALTTQPVVEASKEFFFEKKNQKTFVS